MTRLTGQTEQQIQIALFQWAAAKRINSIFAIPNGGSRNKIEAANLKRAGVKPGVPDIFMAIASRGYHGLWIELKRNSKCKASLEQTEWIKRLNASGYYATVCYGLYESIKIIEWYFGEGLK